MGVKDIPNGKNEGLPYGIYVCMYMLLRCGCSKIILNEIK